MTRHCTTIISDGAQPPADPLDAADGWGHNVLRDGVEQALLTLANGLLQHPANQSLRSRVAAGQLTPREFYRQLLCLVFRLLFLMVAEERGLIASAAHHRDTEAQGLTDGLAALHLHAPGLDPASPLQVYADHCSVGRLRRLADQPASGHSHSGDLWTGLLQTFAIFADAAASARCGLAPLDGALFSANACSDLAIDTCITNSDLLRTINALSFCHDPASQTLRRINYAALDVTALGNVYESLLAFQPVITNAGSVVANPSPGIPHPAAFSLTTGSERKTTGSYYTRPALVQELIKSALEPVITARMQAAASAAQIAAEALAPLDELPHEDRARPPALRAKLRALLTLRVVDPACGSGHFLLAAARRIGYELARLRSDTAEPAPGELRRAMHDVIARCIYGVDSNPLAVDLCKLALAIEGHSAGLPMNFRASHIRRGNSLIGAPETLIASGIPDDAFKPVCGDDKQVASILRRRNRQERGLDTIPGSLAHRQAGPAARHACTRANLWTAAFFQPFTPDGAPFITTRTLRDYERDPASVDADLISRADKLAAELGFFHWELEFPHVFGLGGEGGVGRRGFDVVLGNPPWEMVQLDPREFFAGTATEIVAAPNMAIREQRIQNLKTTSPHVFASYQREKYLNAASQRFIHSSGRFPLTSFGRINLMALFCEWTRESLAADGRAGLIVPTGIATDSFNQQFFRSLIERRQLVSLFDFENRAAIFAAIDRRYKFSLLTFGKTRRPIRFLFFATRLEHLADERRTFSLTPAEIDLINPNTGTAPIFRTSKDAKLTKKMYAQAPILLREGASAENPWRISLQLMFMMNSDSHRFEPAPATGLLPLYEAKMIWQYDHRYGDYADYPPGSHTTKLPDIPAARLQNPDYCPTARYYLPADAVQQRLRGRWQQPWLLGFRDIARSTDERTAVFSLLPYAGVGNKIPLLFPRTGSAALACLLATLNSLPFDYVTRQKIGGTTLNFYILKQLPVLPPTAFTSADVAYIVPRVLELVATAWAIHAFAADVWAEADTEVRALIAARWQACKAAHLAGGERAGAAIYTRPAMQWKPASGSVPPPFVWHAERRAQARAELDARIARLYGLSRDELRYILDPHDVHGPDFPSETFRVLQEKESKQYGEYRTRRLVLAAWDAEA